ncbi:hypothetical protein [Mycobacterium saskatchewanense]|uniref:ESX-1 secretion-associated protein EspJ n=1 Tax=Mycobacterium saskatchewanense TaxID=220927 RepID=A0AAJ3TXQ0_9MYCO|nr:hypothetical protein [Mycobacterium saskatchewanense]ORW74220.1 hypothetical protein AWC23_05400 [Mycobacterium saskatchewanense]
MTEPLVVDPSRLEIAGATLRGLVFPALPAQFAITGTDAVSGAIKDTLPVIEGPVIEGLPAVRGALTRTGSSITAAAGMYAATDQRLGEQLDRVQFFAAPRKAADGRGAARMSGAAAEQPADETTPDRPADGQTPGPTAPQVNPSAAQYGQTMGTLGTFAQSVMQSVQGPMGSMPGGGSPAGLASQGTPGQLVDENEKADGDDEQPQDAVPEGAAPGYQASGNVPPAPLAERPTPASTQLNL